MPAFRVRVLRLLDDAPPKLLAEVDCPTDEAARLCIDDLLNRGFDGTTPENLAVCRLQVSEPERVRIH